MRRKAFTLVELLVVVGIIAILLSLLLPVMTRVRFKARVTQCAANERQLIGTFVAYASDFNDYFPRFDAPSAQTSQTGADNPHDVNYEFYTTLIHRYGQQHLTLFCPFTDEIITSGIPGPGNFVEIGYAYWPPRVGAPSVGSSPTPFPPDPGSGFLVNGTQIIHGPVKLGDPLAPTNPIITDDIYLYNTVTANAPGYSVAQAQPSDFFQQNSTHLYQGKLDVTNEGFADGHVEAFTPDRIVWSYKSGNAWVCR